MNGWGVFLIIALVLGIIISNLMLLKQSAKIKIPERILKEIAEKKQAEKLKQENKKPTGD
ncbi:DUF2897 family protein [Psychromonas hadalis]|uniref:DUF2897 family protein n=1 Tax=Psychromonas hadalis TaxID=211669 RepID=UPI0003B4E8BD|nr:DUF2897 family protein [Psychromonas hadalis]